MIRMLTAYTQEADDAGIAVREILSQLRLGQNLLRNSVGIMSYYPDFGETGVAKAISDTVPFDVIGESTSDAAVPGAGNDIILTLSVLTSDDANFASGVAKITGESMRDALGSLYCSLAASLSAIPSLLYPVLPVVDDVPADDYISVLDEFPGGVPLFGAIASTPNTDFSDIRTFYNGVEYCDAMTLLAISACSPKFFVAGAGEMSLPRQNSLITDSDRNCIKSVNGMPAAGFFESVGLIHDGDMSGLVSMPLILTLSDGSQVMRVFYKVTGEGYLISYGLTPAGATIRFGRGDAEYVIDSAAELASSLSRQEAGAVLLYSCAARKYSLGARDREEMLKIAEFLDGRHSYNFAYSYGEICPVPDKNGRLVNRIHNFTFIACAL